MATLVAELGETDAYRIHRRLSSIATALQTDAACDGHPETRTRDQLRADVLVDLLLGQSGQEAGAGQAGQSDSTLEIQVVVSLETLLGLGDNPGEIPGLGPIPANTARELVADGRWRAWITDATGAVTATGTCGYAPSAGLARLVRARERHCRFPGCRQPATRCDLDHTIPWPTGSTTPENLGPLCRRHHNFKTARAWRIDPRTPGYQWRTPGGFTINDQPEPPLTD